MFFYFDIAQALYRKRSEARLGWQVRTLTGHSCTVVSIAFSADGKRVVGGASFRVKVWDIETGAEVSSFVGVRWGNSGSYLEQMGRFLATFDRERHGFSSQKMKIGIAHYRALLGF